MTISYRANFGDGTHSKAYPDVRDAKREKWARAGIVQYRTSIECRLGDGGSWETVIPSRASQNGPAVVEERS